MQWTEKNIGFNQQLIVKLLEFPSSIPSINIKTSDECETSEHYKDNKGIVSGVYPDILNYIAKKENWKLEYVYGTWEEGLARLKKGEIDSLALLHI